MNSRTALATLTTVSLCLGGVVTAHANATDAAPAAPAQTSAATAPAAAPSNTPTVTVTSTVTETAPTSTVTETAAPATPTDLGSKIVAASTLSEEGQRFFNVLNTVLAVLGALTQAAAVIVAANPELGVQVAQQINATLNQWGVKF